MKVNDSMHLYKGNPREILTEVSVELTKIISDHRIAPSALTCLALIHIAGSMLKSQSYPEMAAISGPMPTFSMVLTTLTKAIQQEETWTEAELRPYEEEFSNLIVALGGQKLTNSSGGPKLPELPFLAPPTDQIH